MNNLIQKYLKISLTIPKTEDSISIDKKIEKLLKIKNIDKNKFVIEELNKNIKWAIKQLFNKYNLTI